MATTKSSDAAECYLKTQVETASKSKAIYMLHERCVHFVLKSESMGPHRATFVRKAQNILSQLQMSLKVNDSTSRSMFYLYDYCHVCLGRGSDPERANALEILRIFQGTFRELLKRP